MRWWQKVLVRAVMPSGVANPAEWLVNMMGGAPTRSGAQVTPDTALGTTPVWRAVTLLAQTIASLPLHVYRDLPGGGKERVRDHALHRLLHAQPNPRQTSFEWREMMAGHLELRGNAYSYIETNRRGEVVALWPRNPGRMRIYIAPDDTIWYEYHPTRGGAVVFKEEEILHLRGFSPDGIVGLSPVGIARESIGVAMAAQEHAAAFYGNGTTLGGVLEHPHRLSPEAFKRIDEAWKKRHSGAGNAWKPAILEEGMKWNEVGMSARDAQFIEGRKFQVDEVARIWGIPPHKLGALDRATFSNIEHQGIEWKTDSILPRCVRWEQRMNASLLLEREREEGYFLGFNIDGIARGDLKARYDAYAVGRNWGWLSADDVREMEDMNPLPNKQGQIYLMPTNMQSAKDPPPAPEAKPPAAPPPATENDDEEDDGGDVSAERSRRLLRAYEPVLVDAFTRAARKELNALRRRAATGEAAEQLIAWHEVFWRDHESTVAEQLMPGISGLLRGVQLSDEDSPELGLRAVAMARAAAVREHELSSMLLRTALADSAKLTGDTIDTWFTQRPDLALRRERLHLLPALSEIPTHAC